MSPDGPAVRDAPAETDAPVAKRVFVTLRGGIATTATFVATILGTVFLVVPSWRPLSRDKIEASLTIPAIESNISTRGWAHRQFPGRGRADEELHRALGKSPTAAQLDGEGTVVYVRLRADGFKRRSIRLRARVYYAATQEAAKNGIYQVYPTSSNLKIDAPSRSSVQLLFLKNLALIEEDALFVRVEAYDGGGILAYADSGKIEKGVMVGSPPP